MVGFEIPQRTAPARQLSTRPNAVFQSKEATSGPLEPPPSLGVPDNIARAGSRPLSTGGNAVHLFDDDDDRWLHAVVIGNLEFNGDHTLMTITNVFAVTLEPGEDFSMGTAVRCGKEGYRPDDVVATIRTDSREHAEPAIRAWIFDGESFAQTDPKGVERNLGDLHLNLDQLPRQRPQRFRQLRRGVRPQCRVPGR